MDTVDSTALRADAPLFLFQSYPGTQLFDYLLHSKRLNLGDTYFGTLASLSTGKLLNPDDLFWELVGKRNLISKNCRLIPLQLSLLRLQAGPRVSHFEDRLLHEHDQHRLRTVAQGQAPKNTQSAAL